MFSWLILRPAPSPRVAKGAGILTPVMLHLGRDLMNRLQVLKPGTQGAVL